MHFQGGCKITAMGIMPHKDVGKALGPGRQVLQGKEGAAENKHGGDKEKHGEVEHLAQIDGNRLRDMALLGFDARIGAGGVDQGQDRHPELGPQPHQPQRLAVALGTGAPEVALQVALGVPTLLVADQHHRPAVDPREPADERAVVGVQPFGGRGLSGTGPKAGGPNYLPRFAAEFTVSNNISAVGGNASLLSLASD